MCIEEIIFTIVTERFTVQQLTFMTIFQKAFLLDMSFKNF